MAGHGAALVQPAALVAALIAAGGPVARWLAPGAGRADRVPLALLIGFGAGAIIPQGLAFAGLADTGLLRIASAAAVAAGVVTFVRRRAWRAWVPAGPGERLPALVCGLVLAAGWAVSRVPDMFEDALTYHLAAPEQWLGLHRIVAEPYNVAWHFTLGAEALTMPLLACGGPGAGKLTAVVAAVALPPVMRRFAAACGGSAAGGWWAAALACGAALVPVACWGAKNDLLAAVLGAGAAWGFMASRHGRHVLLGAGWWCAGAAVAVKTTAGLLGPAALAILLAPGGRRARPRLALGALTLAFPPVAGWCARNWLHLGNPAYPFLSGWFPTLSWGPAYLAGLAATQQSFASAGAFAPAAIPSQPVAVLLDPSFGSAALAVAAGAVLVGGVPGLRVGLAAGIAVWAVTHRFPRYLAPFVPLLAAAVVPWLVRLATAPRFVRAAAATALLVPPLVAALLASSPPAWRVWLGQMSPDAFAAKRYSTLEDARRWVNGHATGGVLLTGDERRFGFRPRTRSAVGPCEPLLWKLAHETADVPRFGIRLRQLGIGTILHNFIAAEFRAMHWYAPHDWSPRALGVYAAFARSSLRVAYAPEAVDYANGGWIAWTVARRPTLGAPVFFLPQTEGRLRPVRRLLEAGRTDDAVREMDRLAAMTPGVRQDEHMRAYALLAAGRFADALRIVRPGIADGFAGNGNLDVCAGALASLGRIAEAVAWQARACRRLPAEDALDVYGSYLRARARDARALDGDWRGALRDAEAAAMVRPDRWEAWADAAGYAVRLERFGPAAAHARRALALNPGHPGLAGLVRELDPLARTTISR